MNAVKIPLPFKSYDNSWFINFITTYKSNYFEVRKSELVNIINLADESNIKIILYVIYQIILNDLIDPSSINPKPNGIELKNPNTLVPLGIYHIHLNDGYVLLWYLIWNKNNKIIKFEYLQHPPRNDNYKTIIKEIYQRNDKGFNETEVDYFIDIQHILNFDINENLIMTFKDFIKIRKID